MWPFSLIRSSFSRDVLSLTLGTIVAQALLVLAIPLLTRLYSPEDFGVYASFGAITFSFAGIVCWCYELAIVLPERDEDAISILWAAILIALGMSTFTLGLVAVFRGAITKYLEIPEPTLLWFIPVTVLASGIYQALNYWSTRKKRFKSLAVSRISRSVASVGTQAGVGALMAGGTFFLILGRVIGQVVASIVLSAQVYRKDGRLMWHGVNRGEVRRQAIRYKNFPVYSMPLTFMNTFSRELPKLLFVLCFSNYVLGLYALCSEVLVMPMVWLGSSIAQVFFPRANEEQRGGNLSKLTERIFGKLFVFAFVPMLLFMVSAPDIFSVLFGEEWRVAGNYAQWLAPCFFFQFISSPLAQIFYVFEKQKTLLLWNTLFLFSRALAIAVGASIRQPVVSIILFAAVGVVAYILLASLIFRLTGSRLRNCRREVWDILGGLPIVGGLIMARRVWGGNSLVGSAMFCGCVLLFAAVLAARICVRRIGFLQKVEA